VENYLAGVLLSTRNPFEIGDAVEIDGQVGKVARLTSRDTVLMTLDGNHLRIPNAIVMNSVLLNYSRNPKRRFDFSVGVSTEFDLTEAKRIGLEALASNPGILSEPKPLAVIDSLGDSSVAMKFFAWLDQTDSDFLKTKSEAIRLVKEAFDDAGIEMPEPIYRVHIRERSEGESVRGEAPSTTISSVRGGGGDISVDTSIDEQIEEELAGTGENLLSTDTEEERQPKV
jgi:small-conductance mechanosensitive channel